MDGAYGNVSFVCTQTDDCEATETMRDHQDVAIQLGHWDRMTELSKLLGIVNNELFMLCEKDKELKYLCKKPRDLSIAASKLLAECNEAIQKEGLSQDLAEKKQWLRSEERNHAESKMMAESDVKAWKAENQAGLDELEKQKRGHQLKLKCECVLVRNSYSEKCLNDDIKAGLQELLQEVEDDKDEVDMEEGELQDTNKSQSASSENQDVNLDHDDDDDNDDDEEEDDDDDDDEEDKKEEVEVGAKSDGGGTKNERNFKKVAKDTQRDLNRSLLNKIRNRMESGYKSAIELEGGPGKCRRMKDAITTQAKAYVESMFEVLTKELLKGIEDLIEVLSNMISALSMTIQNTMKEVYTVYWDDQGHVSAPVRKCRDSPSEAARTFCAARYSHGYDGYRTAVSRIGPHSRWNLGGSYKEKLHEAEKNGEFVDLTKSDTEWQDYLPTEAFYRPNQVVSCEL